MKNAEWVIKQGKNFADLIYRANGETDNYEIIFGSKIIGKIRIGATLKNPVLAWLDMEHKEPILDEAEKKYLSAVIKPFRDDVRNIRKIQSIYRLPDGGKEYIKICMRSDEEINFPYFRKDSMYKGMEFGRSYSLEELGL